MNMYCFKFWQIIILFLAIVTVSAAFSNKILKFHPDDEDYDDDVVDDDEDFDDDDDDLASGAVTDTDNEYIEGSSDGPVLTACQREEQEALQSRNYSKMVRYVPQCTDTGEYEPKQCSKSTAKPFMHVVACWCVNDLGQEQSDTRVAGHIPINCSTVETGLVKNSRKQVESSTRPPSSLTSKRSLTTAKGGGEIQKPQQPSLNPGSSVSGNTEKLVSSNSKLAGVVVGVVVKRYPDSASRHLRCLSVEKKDEGSYALEEPLKSPTIGYTMTPDREFFA